MTYLGPPGTGKTQTLLGEVERLIKAGTRPDRIGFMSFTRQAVNEAVARTKKDPDEVPYFRTIHSLCFRLCGLSTSAVMGHAEYAELGEKLGLELSGDFSRGRLIDELGPAERALAFIDMARATMSDLRTLWETTPGADEVDWDLVKSIADGLAAFKRDNLLVDFTGMIERYVAGGPTPPLDVLIVDEAQDLSLLQWKAVEKLAGNCRRVVLAGDDDQALYYWAGSRPEIFKAFAERGEIRVLSQSHRLPGKIHSLAQKIVLGIKDRLPKDYRPRPVEGAVEDRASYDDIDMGAGTWLVLVRNRYMLKQALDHCRREGYHYQCFLDTPQRWDSVKALVAWERLRKGQELRLRDVAHVMEYVKNAEAKKRFKAILPVKGRLYGAAEIARETGADFNRPWFEALDVRQDEAEYVRSALRRGEKITQPPRVRIDTIHGSKGSEAENVVLKTDVSRKTAAGMERDPDQERRVFYVGATRARENLFLLRPETPNYFNLETL